MRASSRVAIAAKQLESRISAAPATVRYVLAAASITLFIAIIVARDSNVASQIVERSASGLEAAGLDAVAVGALVFAVWSFLPVVLYGCALFAESRFLTGLKRSWLSMPFAGLAVSGHLTPGEAGELLSPASAGVYDLLMIWMFRSVFAGLAMYGLYRLSRWFIKDERQARDAA